MREAPIGIGRATARLAGSESASPYVAPRGPSLTARLAETGTRTLRAIRSIATTPGSTPRRGAVRRGAVPVSYSLFLAALVSRAAYSGLARLHSRSAASRVAAFRRRTAAERRLVTAFALSLVLVGSVLADARPALPLGNANGAGQGVAAVLPGLAAPPDDLAANSLGANERADSVDAGVRYDPATIDGTDPGNVSNGAPYLPDGTLLKPVAIDGEYPYLVRTTVLDYTVQSGDTLTGIAARYHVSMATLWWANKLSSKDQLHVGQTIVIPPVSGLLWTVKEGDTLASIAAATQADPQDIVDYNGLTSDTLLLGMQLMIPGGQGAALPTNKPTAKPVAAGGGSTSRRLVGTGQLLWPVAGGYISQYFSSYHKAIDIAAPGGTPVYAADSGKVIWAGWRSNCGGYQIWLDHGDGMWTTYNHLSAILVGAGTYVGRGQTIGRVGMSGCATGTHLHFAVWLGGAPFSSTGYEVNPLLYL